jgi:hypothetical protein
MEATLLSIFSSVISSITESHQLPSSNGPPRLKSQVISHPFLIACTFFPTICCLLCTSANKSDSRPAEQSRCLAWTAFTLFFSATGRSAIYSLRGEWKKILYKERACFLFYGGEHSEQNLQLTWTTQSLGAMTRVNIPSKGNGFHSHNPFRSFV